MTTDTDIVIPQTEGGGGGNYLSLAPGTYDAIVRNIEEVANPYEVEPGASTTQLEITFEFPGHEDADGRPGTMRTWANCVFNPYTKLWKWSTAILGTTPAEGEPFRTSSLIGQPCRVFVNIGKKKSDNTEYAKIVDVLGTVRARPQKPPLAARLKAEAPPALDICAVETCGGEVDRYTKGGKPLCVGHTADDL